MRKTRWWLRIVGVFYLALVLMNVIGASVSDSLIRDVIPFEVDDAGVRAFLDAWMVFILALGAMAVAALYASTRVERAEMLVVALVVGELSFGVVGDLWFIARGYSVAAYVPFAVLHLVIAGVGLYLLQTEVRHGSAAAAPVAAPSH